ncbi:hypothetical protein MPSEU_001102500 [Mayamaea pseudoterrestris]|nr:hypothetical protein MPSEU_001102500 [Mayamaea pseudoterrestris]
MKLSLAICAAVATSAAAFQPAVSQRSGTALNMDRRAAIGQAVVGAATIAALPQLALADGAVSGATIARAKFNYGSKIYSLKSAVEKGDFDAVAAEKNSFILFNSGVYPTAKSKPLKKAAISATNEIFRAVKSKDAKALKEAYGAYLAANSITAPAVADKKTTQGYSNDFDYKVRTTAGTIYQR